MSNMTRFDPLEDLFRGFFVKPIDFPNAQLPVQGIRMDVKEEEKAFVVHAELPGARKEDIHVTIDGNLVSLSAEVKQEKEVKNGERVLRSERYFGKVSRSFQLAQDVNEAEATAKFSNGVLELTLPKKAPTATRRLMIE